MQSGSAGALAMGAPSPHTDLSAIGLMLLDLKSGEHRIRRVNNLILDINLLQITTQSREKIMKAGKNLQGWIISVFLFKNLNSQLSAKNLKH